MTQKTNIYDLFKTDSSLEQEGIWYDLGEAGRILLARAGGANMRFAKVMEAKTRPYRQQIERGTIADDVSNRLLAEAFAEGVILNWENIKDADGNDLPFTKENVAKLLLDLPDLFAELREVATKAANFRAIQLEDDSGN